MNKLNLDPAPFVAFGSDDVTRAAEEWGCSGLCGPVALCACLGFTLDQIRPHLGDFEARGYTSPPMMQRAIVSAGFRWHQARGDGLPTHGLVRVIFSGPWLLPGVPRGAAAVRSHWVASKAVAGENWVFDVNSGWERLCTWTEQTGPRIAASYKRSDGGWFWSERWEVRKQP